jgi:hypothetical protein
VLADSLRFQKPTNASPKTVKRYFMRHSLPFIAVLTVAFSFCTFKGAADKFEFGMKYNSVRNEFGSPLIKHNMSAHNCCGKWTVYEIDKVPSDSNAYHSSKTIRAITNGKLTNEEDIYRKNLDDTTILQLNLETVWQWTSHKLDIYGNVGKIDNRTLNIKAKDFISENRKYPDYEFTQLNQSQIDSLLSTWGLSRFDKE